MTTKITKTSEGNTEFAWESAFWVQKEGATLNEYYNEEEMERLLTRLNRGAEMMAFGIKNVNGKTMYMPRHFASIRMLKYDVDGKKYSHHTRKNDPNGYDAYFVLDYATRTWNQKTGENIGILTDNAEIQLIKALNKLVKYDYEVNGVKNRRGRGNMY
jgi:hypothetical protein